MFTAILMLCIFNFSDSHAALMFFPERQLRIFVYGEPVNIRLSYTELYAKLRNVIY